MSTLERELRSRIDDKFRNAIEEQRREAKNLTNKLTLLKNEIAISLLDKDTIDFVRNVKREWNHVLSRSKTFEERVANLQN